MSKILRIFMMAVCCGVFSGCAALVDPDTSLFAPHKWDEIFRNRENLAKLQTKMTRDEVLEIMGEPIKGEVYCEDNIWWYYTRTVWNDYMTTRDECTPVIFNQEDRVEGWGMTYYRNKFGYVSWSEKSVKQVLE